ncbi:MAG: hypothetical protein M1816_003668 [Peltula sp. TS41687]|nr:MAG: hypothetical protein M1816_003668 [Peltula sp. TS41687]
MESQQQQRPRPTIKQETAPMRDAGSQMPIVPDTSIGPGIDRKLSLDNPNRIVSTAAVSMDDPDVRIAAEALGQLRADFIQSPPSRRPRSPPPSFTMANQDLRNGGPSSPNQQEPLLSLLTTSHPLISTAINGSLSAYTVSKSYSPRFKYGAEFVERHIGSPVASTVGSVGRKTGVEGGMRWWLGSGRARHAQQGSPGEDAAITAKRRKLSTDDHQNIDIEQGLRRTPSLHALPAYAERRPSDVSFAESLPAYDDNRSPTYEPRGALVPIQRGDASSQSSSQATWQSRLMLSTSGLGVAMSEESLRSLRYCLTWIRWANVNLGKILVYLKDVVEKYESSPEALEQNQCQSLQVEDGLPEKRAPSDTQTSLVPLAEGRETVARRIDFLKAEALKTLKNVVDVVSKYAGGALPENARKLVKYYLISFPQRFRHASAANKPKSDSLQQHSSQTVASAHRVIVLAKEGLDMMAQVSTVLNGTISSAEDWCDRLGRRKTGETDDDSNQTDRKVSETENGEEVHVEKSPEKMQS